MFRQIVRFFRRIFQSKGFRTATRIIFWILAGYFMFSCIYAISQLMRMGMSFHQAAVFLFETLFGAYSRPLLSVAMGIVIGILVFYRRRGKTTAPEAEDTPAEVPEAEPAQEEEIIGTRETRSQF